MRISTTTLVPWIVFGLCAGCADLPALDRGTCGNGIVEPANGEQCDTFPLGTCRAAGTTGECRFDCTARSDGTSPACPDGFGCGADGVCRNPSGNFSFGIAPVDELTTAVQFADLDGDGLKDIVSTGDEVNVAFADSVSPFTTRVSLPSQERPELGMLTNDSTWDLVLLMSDGLAVARGRTDRTLVPTPYTSMAIEGTDILLVTMDAMLPNPLLGTTNTENLWYYGQEILLAKGNSLTVAAPVAKDLFTIPGLVANIAGGIRVADVVEAPEVSPCQELVIGLKGEDHVSIYTPCRVSGSQVEWNAGAGAFATVMLPSGITIKSTVLASDMNGDQHVDIMIEGSDGSPYVVFGYGDGTFRDTIAESSPPVKTNIAAKVAMTIPGEASPSDPFSSGSFPLDIADMNGDGIPDPVLSSGVLISFVPPEGTPPATWYYRRVASETTGLSWSLARIGDFNANGLLDVVATRQNRTDVIFLNGAGKGVFNRFEVSTEGTPVTLEVGDFDGDLIQDVVIREQDVMGSSESSSTESLSLLYGRSAGPPEAPVTAARFSTIQQILPTSLSAYWNDGESDLIVVTPGATDTTTAVAVFGGSGDRLLKSEIRFINVNGYQASVPRAAAVGQFDGDEAGHVDVAVIVQGPGSTDSTDGNRLWLMPSTGEADLDIELSSEGDLIPSEFAAEYSLMGAVDLDKDGLDEVVLLGPLTSGTTTEGGVLIARSVQGTNLRKWALDSVLSVTETFGNWGPNGTMEQPGIGGPSSDAGDPGTGGNLGSMSVPRLKIADIDGDGLKDLVAMGGNVTSTSQQGGTSPGGGGGNGSGGATSSMQTSLVLFRNTGSGSLDVTKRLVISAPQGEFVQGFGFVQADQDKALELVLLTTGNVYLVQVDLAAGTSQSPVVLPSVTTGFDADSEDLNGDGVQDLVIAGRQGVQVYYGEPVMQ